MDNIKEKVLEFWNVLFGDKDDSRMNDLEKYQRKMQRQKQMRILIILAIVAVALFVVLVMKSLIENRSYDSYRVVETSEQLDSSILQYQEMGSYVLKYSGDGVSLLDASDEVLWNDSIQMTAPLVECFGEMAAVYENRGTITYVYGVDGKLGEIKTEYPILKISISGQGGVAMLLEKADGTLMNYYSYDGTLIASSTSNMRNPGYPVDLSLSEDGMSLAITYFVADGESISSYLAFYNFGEQGKDKEDNLMDGFRFDSILVPEIQYLDDETLVAYREDGFTLYRGNDMMEEIKSVEFEQEIVSCFSDRELFGFIFTGSDQRHAFEMKVYNASGKLEMETGFDILYDEVKISGNQIILYNANQLAVIGSNGTEHFCGDFEEGTILDVVKKGMNRYAVACNKGVVTIVLD